MSQATNNNRVFCKWRPVFWEPVRNTGERLMAGVIGEHDGQWFFKRTLDDEILFNLYGSKSDSAKSLIEVTLSEYENLCRKYGIEEIKFSLSGLTPGPLRETKSNSPVDIAKQAALLYSSLTNFDALDKDKVFGEQSSRKYDNYSRHFSVHVKKIIKTLRPDISQYVNRHANIAPEGKPIKFGFYSNNLIAHFSFLSRSSQNQSQKNTRIKMWEIMCAHSLTNIGKTALVTVNVAQDAALLGRNQSIQLIQTLSEIQIEAKNAGIEVYSVSDPLEGARKLIELHEA